MINLTKNGETPNPTYKKMVACWTSRGSILDMSAFRCAELKLNVLTPKTRDHSSIRIAAGLTKVVRPPPATKASTISRVAKRFTAIHPGKLQPSKDLGPSNGRV